MFGAQTHAGTIYIPTWAQSNPIHCIPWIVSYILRSTWACGWSFSRHGLGRGLWRYVLLSSMTATGFCKDIILTVLHNDSTSNDNVMLHYQVHLSVESPLLMLCDGQETVNGCWRRRELKSLICWKDRCSQRIIYGTYHLALSWVQVDCLHRNWETPGSLVLQSMHILWL